MNEKKKWIEGTKENKFLFFLSNVASYGFKAKKNVPKFIKKRKKKKKRLLLGMEGELLKKGLLLKIIEQSKRRRLGCSNWVDQTVASHIFSVSLKDGKIKWAKSGCSARRQPRNKIRGHQKPCRIYPSKP